MSFTVSRGGAWWSADGERRLTFASADPALPAALATALAEIERVEGVRAESALAGAASAQAGSAPLGSAQAGADGAASAQAESAQPTAQSLPQPTGAIAAGFLGFEPDAPAVFEIASHVAAGPVPQAAPARAVSVRPRPARAEYERSVARALQVLAEPGALRKVVLGRWVDALADTDLDAIALAATLATENTDATVLSLPTDARDDGEALVTATPELLIARRGRHIVSRPLAGSAVRHPDAAEDARRAQGLARDAKNLNEHRFVVEAIADCLAPLCADLHVPAQPGLVSTPTMWHLATELTGTLREDVSVAQLAQLLHPTPAVAGTPTAAARDLISDLEIAPRGPLTGAAGWVDAAGDGEFHVVIRAALIAGKRAALFAGAGIVPGSVPADEAAETAAKMRTVLTALGYAAPFDDVGKAT